MEETKFIDIDNVIKSKSKRLYALLPWFIISYIKKIVHENEINSFISKNKNYYGVAFIERFLEEYNLKIETQGEEHIINNKRLLIASNHPLGGLDGIALLYNIGKYKPVMAVINDILMYLENLNSLFVPINKHGNNPKSYIKALNETFESDADILYFPAGLCSRKKGKVIMDLEWKKSFIQKSVKCQRDIVPTFVGGRNTDFFYNMANFRKEIGIKANIEMLYLVDEMYKQRGSTIKIIYGKPISYKVFDYRMDELMWAQKVKAHCYALGKDSNIVFKYE